MYAHIVPKVYLQKWKVDGYNKSIYYFEKPKNEWKQRNINKVGGESNYYKLPLFDFENPKYSSAQLGWVGFAIETYAEIFPDFFDKVYETILSQYEFMYDNEILFGREFLKYLLKILPDPDCKMLDNSVSKKRIINAISAMWENEYAMFVEEALRDIETNWGQKISDTLLSELEKDSEPYVTEIFFSQIIQFLSIQQARDKRYTIVDNAITESIEIVRGILKDFCPYDFTYSEKDYFVIWLMQLTRYFKQSKRNIIDALIAGNSKATLFFIHATETNKFITTNMPVLTMPSSGKGDYTLFPISPQWCLCLGIKDKVSPMMLMKYYKLQATDTIVAYINNLFFEKSEMWLFSNANNYTYKSMPKPSYELQRMWSRVGLISPM